jgi:hypothetical protein
VETGGVVQCHPAQIPTVHQHQHYCSATYNPIYIKRNVYTIIFLFNCLFFVIKTISQKHPICLCLKESKICQTYYTGHLLMQMYISFLLLITSHSLHWLCAHPFTVTGVVELIFSIIFINLTNSAFGKCRHALQCKSVILYRSMLLAGFWYMDKFYEATIPMLIQQIYVWLL